MSDPFTNPKPAEGPIGPPMKEEHFLRGSTPMHKAAALLKFDEVDKLLAEGSTDVDTGDVLAQTPLLLLSRNHYDPDDVPKAADMIKKLLAAGATLVVDGKCRRDDYGDSCLHLAAMATCKNGPLILKTLVDALPDGPLKGQLLSARCKNFGNTALHWATLSGDADACQCLIDAGARLDRKNRLKEDVLAYANKYEHPKLKVKFEALLAK